MYIIKMITKSNQTKFYTINQAGKKAPISHWVIRDLIAAKVPVIIKQAVR